ncbi:unnamed protein product [Clavelina lepadiformis]|uniref:ribonuclease III n=1 Tax=Clavelina lepadiformis TaxID=159417 RepID=A0ABP0FWI7_CLALP
MHSSFSPLPSKVVRAPCNSNLYTNIFTPIPYQIELLECAVKRNTIVCLNTEYSKRFISFILIRELVVKCEDDLDQLSLAILLLNSDVVVKEQEELLQHHLNLNVIGCTRESSSFFSQDDWKNVFTKFQVVVMTPEVLLNGLNIDLSFSNLIDLLIFDECNLVCKETHPYRKIMQILDANSLLPNILGLTSSLLYDNITADELNAKIENMESLLHCKAETATDLIALDKHSLSKPIENIILSSDQNKDQEVVSSNLNEDIRKVLNSALAWLSTCQVEEDTLIRTIDWEIDEVLLAAENKSSDAESPIKSSKSPTDHNAVHPKTNNTIEINNYLKLSKAENSTKNDVTTSVNGLKHETPDSVSERHKKLSNYHKKIGDFDRASKYDNDRGMQLCVTPKAVLKEILLILDVLGPWCVYKLVVLVLKQLQKSLTNVEREYKAAIKDQVEDEITSGRILWEKTLFQYVQTKLRMIYTMCHHHIGSNKAFDFQFVTPKVHRLLQVLREYQPISEPEKKQAHKYNDRNEADYVSWWQDSDAEDEEDNETVEDKKTEKKDDGYTSPFTNTLCGIVFVHDRCVAMMLQKLLRDICKEEKNLKHVNSTYLSPSEANPARHDFDTSETDKSKQEEVLRKFRSHESNLLVCSSSLEECASLPKCNLIVSFDVPVSYRSYVESKSRARANTSAYVMLVRENEKKEFMEKLQEYKKIEEVLQGPVWYDDNDVNVEHREEMEDYDDIIAPYSTCLNATANLQNAIKIVNRYCSRLPSDPFTYLSPHCDITEEVCTDYFGNQAMYQCTLQLPINSHVREPILGVSMPTVLLAQRAVAVETCKLLHESGELDDNLMPIGKETVKYAEELDPWKAESTTVPGRPGSTKRRQTYDKEVPTTLSKCLPLPEESLFLYEIEMKIQIPLPNELNVRMRKLYFPEHTPRCFGILTMKPIPQIPGTPVFTRSGEELAKLKLCRSYLSLSAQQIKLIRSFHRYVFSDMLRVDRVPLSFHPENSSSQILIVVLDRIPSSRYHPHTTDVDIDWSFMMKTDAKRRMIEKMKRDPWYHHRVSERTKIFTFNKETYEDGVVVAKYRSCDQPNRFYVAEIKEDLDPLSSFPSNEYQSFKQYYKVKYGLDIRCNEQPLLDVDHTSSRLNLLTPRHLNQKGKALPMSSLEKKRAKYESLHNRQILVPELCEVHPIPASLWRKAVCLPSIIYRVTQLLISEELRRDIAAKSGIVDITPPLGHTWPDLAFGWDAPSSNIIRNEEKSTSSPDPDEAKVDAKEQPTPANEKIDQNIASKTEQTSNSELSQTHSVSLCCDHQTHLQTNTQTPSSTVKTIADEDSVLNKSSNLQPSQGGLDVEDKEKTSNVEKPPYPAHTFDEINRDTSEVQQLAEMSTENVAFETDDGASRVPDSPDSGSSDASFFSDDFETYFTLSDTESAQVSTKKLHKHRPKKKSRVDENKHVLTQNVLENFLQNNPVDLSKVGPGPGIILQALTLSNASDGFNLERLEMLGDSFLKHAVTVYLYCAYPDAHEGKLSYMRSKKVSNYNLYRIGRAFGLASKMTAHIFDPTVNWMPAGFIVGSSSAEVDSDPDDLSDDDVEIGVWTGIPDHKKRSSSSSAKETTSSSSSNPSTSAAGATADAGRIEVNEEELFEEDEIRMIDGMLGGCLQNLGSNLGSGVVGKKGGNGLMGIDLAEMVSSHQSMHFTDKAALRQSTLPSSTSIDDFVIDTWAPVDLAGKPLNNTDPLMLDLHNQHSLADKSVADCVEALLGAFLTSCGHRAAQLFLCHLGLMVLPQVESPGNSEKTVDRFKHLVPPPNKTLQHHKMGAKLNQLLQGMAGFEKKIGYTFKNKSYLLQALTHASYFYNTITDCYQRLEFLGDAVLDFLITRHLFNDSRQHAPGALTDLRSALVNNTIFASLAVRYDYHKYFKSISPDLQKIVEEFVFYQQKQEEAQGMDAQLMRHYGESPMTLEGSEHPYMDIEEEEAETEDVEVPKALGDIFESVAGAIFMDSGMDLNAVWEVYSAMMLPLIEKFSACVPRSPVRELLEMEPETAKFSCAEKRYDGKVRVTVEIIGKGRFKGVGRSYRIAKSAAARRALRVLKGGFSDGNF